MISVAGFCLLACPVIRAARLTGVVTDALTGVPVEGAAVSLLPDCAVVSTDMNGAFAFSNVGPGRYELEVSARGYSSAGLEHIDIRRRETGVRHFKIPLEPVSYTAEILVTAEPVEVRFRDIMTTEIPVELLADEPGALEDPVKKVQTLPGVAGSADFMSVLYVRGGASDETMLFLDRSYLLNPYHLGGAFTVFFEDLVDKVEFYTGGFPARYGNALSGVLDVTYRSGDRAKFRAMADLSLISAKIRLEGPIQKSRISYLLAFRRSYWDYAAEMADLDDDIAAPYFGDLFGKITYFASTRRISLSILDGADGLERFTLEDSAENPDAEDSTFFYLNRSRLVDLTWEEWFNPMWNLTGTVSHSIIGTEADLTGTDPIRAEADIRFLMSDIQISRETETVRYSTGIQAGKARIRLNSFLSDYWYSTSGARQSGNDNPGRSSIQFTESFAFQAIWSELEWAASWDRLMQATAGIRVDRWESTGEITLAPRLNLMAGMTDRIRLRAAAGIFYQYPYDILESATVYGNPDLKSERARHLILGLEGDVTSFFKIRAEGFYKWYDRSIVNHDTREAAWEALKRGNPFVNEGRGFAYGGELFCQLFPWRFLDGWFTYGYSLTRIANPLHRENPEWYYPLQDQRHTAHLVLNVRPLAGWIFSARASFNTGRPNTEITGWDLELDRDPPHFPIWVARYGSLNADRTDSYFRLDLRIRRMKRFRNSELSVYVDLINVTNRKNVYVETYDSGDPQETEPEPEPTYNLPFIPVFGIGYQF
ncbi:TonB-dependent receptor [bacterium]|nr:TonB-dependent receptor [candidate division CSSED10-310 bacterium]